jgi:DNA-binding NtrC family response regulator
MKTIVLYVDDDPSNLKAISRLFRNEPFDVVTELSPLKALSRIETLKPAVIISDQRMPEMDGTVFLREVEYRHPDSVRIILTGDADLEAAMDAINKGHVFRFIQKPWDDDDLKSQVKAALEHQESIHCLRTIVDTLVDEVIDNEKSQKSTRKLAAAVSRELNQPLMIVGGYIQLLQAYFKDDDIPRDYLSNMLLQINRIDALAQKIQLIARTPADAGPGPKAYKN